MEAGINTSTQRNYLLVPLTTCVIFAEWVEYSLFMYLGTTISPLFFPNADAHVALMLTYAIFALAYFTRPVGGLIFGYFADTRGRTPPMIVSCLLMGLATFGIGLLPTYDAIGIYAPIALLLLRMSQSLAVAGEYNNAAILLMEHSQGNVTLAGSWIAVAAAGGMFCGGYLASQVGDSISWRLPFIIVGVLAVGLMLLRRYLMESPQFMLQRDRDVLTDNPLRQLLKQHKFAMLKIAAAAIFINVFCYICNIYFVTFLIEQGIMSKAKAALVGSLAQLGVAVLIPLVALTCTRIPYTRWFVTGTVLMALAAWTLFFSVVHQQLPLLYLGLVVYSIASGAASATVFHFMFDCVPVSVRCTATSMAWGLAAAIFGGTAPIIATKTVAMGWVYFPPAYVTLAALFAAFIVIYSSKK